MSKRPGHPDSGFLYVATGTSQYAEEAVASLRSLRDVSPAAHVTLITDVPEAELDPTVIRAFDRVMHEPPLRYPQGGSAEPWKLALLFKVRLLAMSPYERTIFVDSDTLFLEDCSPLFELLDHYDLCATQAPADAVSTEFGDRVLVGHTPLNSGMLAYRANERMSRLLARWYAEYERGLDRYYCDQPALMRALLDVPDTRVFVLQSIWNTRFPYNERLLGRVRLLHGRHANIERIAQEINRSPMNRVWLANAEVCVYRGMALRDQARVIVRLIVRWMRGLVRRVLSGPTTEAPVDPGVSETSPEGSH